MMKLTSDGTQVVLRYDCTACGGEGWLPSRPEGESACPYCKDGKVTETRPARHARIRTLRLADDEQERLGRYLPSNYEIVDREGEDGREGSYLVAGYDAAGWTLDAYVIPRLASGLIWAEEVKQDA